MFQLVEIFMQRDVAVHERLADRLASILTKLNMGQQLNIKALAIEFKVSTRTISRDFDRLSASLPLLKNEKTKCYYLDEKCLGKLTSKDLYSFAKLSGISHLYPALDQSALNELLDHKASQTYSVKGYAVEDASQFKHLFEVFKTAIQEQTHIEFSYKGVAKSVQPYRLIHHHGNWYLAAVYEYQLRAYRLSRIELLAQPLLTVRFEINPAVIAQLDKENTIWFGQEKIEVIVSVDVEVASHFQSRSLLPEQSIVKQHVDGSLLISTQITHNTQLLPLVRYWIPHLKIISPEGLQGEMEQGLRQYLKLDIFK